MNEIEVKAKAGNINKIRKHLESLGCKFSDVMKQDDVIFTKPEVDFLNSKKGDVFLRIREQNGKNLLTLKQQNQNELDNIEKELEICDNAMMAEIMGIIGFREVVKVSKKRIKTKYGNLEICLDQVESLGDFIEVEKISDENSENVQNELFDFLKSLGVKESDQVLVGYDTMIYKINQRYKAI